MYLLLKLTLVAACVTTVQNEQVSWKDMKHVRTEKLQKSQSSRSLKALSPSRLKYFADLKINENHFKRALEPILTVRIPDTEGIRKVRNFITDEMSSYGWTVELDTFKENTVIGPKEFTNIIATLDPEAPRRMVIACHYDSKIEPKGFLGATDSAVPCAQMLNIAHTMKLDLDDYKSDLTLQFIFFDGEEAFKQWTDTDSIYGARHLASKWHTEQFTHNRISGSSLERIDIFVLLDLLGTKDPRIISSQPSTDPWFRKLIEIESGLVKAKSIKGPRIFQTMATRYLGIEDDHIPFLKKDVPILHLIPVPFPQEWHTLADNGDAIDYPTVEKLNKILRVFVAEYLEIA